MYIRREAEEKLNFWLDSDKILIILGARQVGKTTLIKNFLSEKKTVFFNLDIEVDKNRLMALSALSPSDVSKSLNYPDYIVIDEAPREKEVGRIVKGWYDVNLPVKVILLGSSSLNLLNQTAESLTGRNIKIFLTPFIFVEVLSIQEWYSEVFSQADIYNNFSLQIKTLLMQTIVFGSYPEVVLSGNSEDLLLNLTSDYLLKDVLQIGLIKNSDLIKKLLMLLAFQVGAEVSINELARSLGASRATIENYLDILEKTYVIFRLPAFSTNPRKEISKSRKIYFWDTGIRNALLKEFSTSPLRLDMGALWENWVIAELYKQNLVYGNKKNFYFWRSVAKSEVDLVIKSGSEIRAFEIKYQERTINKRAFVDRYNVDVELISFGKPLPQLDW